MTQRHEPSELNGICNFFFEEKDENSQCLLCSRILAGHPKFAIERHYNTTHKELNNLVGAERSNKLAELKRRSIMQRDGPNVSLTNLCVSDVCICTYLSLDFEFRVHSIFVSFF